MFLLDRYLTDRLCCCCCWSTDQCWLYHL